MRCQLKIVGQQKRERKLTGLNTLPAVRRTKGLSKSRGASRLQTGPAQPEAGCRGGGERGKLGPKDSIPYHTANRPPVSNQRLPEISGWSTSAGTAKHRAQAPNPCPTKAGAAEGRRRAAPRESAPIKLLAA